MAIRIHDEVTEDLSLLLRMESGNGDLAHRDCGFVESSRSYFRGVESTLVSRILMICLGTGDDIS